MRLGRRNRAIAPSAAGAGIALLLAVFALLCAAPAEAQSVQTLVSNTGKDDGELGSLSSFDHAQAFTTGSNEDGYTLTSVEIKFASVTNASTSYAVSIYTSKSSTLTGGVEPDTLLASLTGPASLVADSLNTYTASGSGIALDKDTTYFVLVDSSSSAGNNLRNTASNDEDGASAAGWSIADESLYRNRGGGAWLYFVHTKIIQISGRVTDASNATGAPSVSGSAQVGRTLTAGKGDIADPDGLPASFPGGYAFQWLRVNRSNVESAIAGATSHTYMPVAADVDHTLKVRVRFFDDGGYLETLDSAATSPVVSDTVPCPAGADWCTTLTVGMATGAVTFYGYYASAGDSTGGLVDPSITYGDATRTVSSLGIYDGPGTDVLEDYVEVRLLGGFLPRGTVFDFGGTEFAASGDSEQTQVGRYVWPIPAGFSWTDGQLITVSAKLARARAVVGDAGRRSLESATPVMLWDPDRGTQGAYVATGALVDHVYRTSAYVRFDGPLWATGTYLPRAAVDAFTITVGGTAMTPREGIYVGDATTTDGVWLSLPSGEEILRGQTVTLSYDRTAAGSAADIGARSFRNLRLRNKSSYTGPGTTVKGAEVNASGTQLLLEFSEELNFETFNGLSLKTAFTVTADGSYLGLLAIGKDISRNDTLSILVASGNTIKQGQAVTVHYNRAAAGSDALEDENGRKIESFGVSVTNNSTALRSVSIGPKPPPPKTKEGKSDAQPKSADGEALTEGSPAVFTLTRSGDTADALTVSVSVTESGSMLSGTPPATVTFAAGSATAELSVATEDDAVAEPASTITATVSEGTGYTVNGDAGSASVTVEDDDGVPDPLTASFEEVPEDHVGNAATFTLKLRFSEDVKASAKRMREAIIGVKNGTLSELRRIDRRKDYWVLTLRPDDHRAVTVSLRAGETCKWRIACTFDGRALSEAVSARIAGPPGLSVADAAVDEGAGATLDFAVTLSRASTRTVTVDYRSADGTAAVDEDYEQASGTLTFDPGETSKTVSVPVLDDTHDEGDETMTLVLSNPLRGRIADGEGVGTIRNTDLMPQAWLARFGRTVADQVMEAVEGRVTSPRSPGAEMSIAGRSFGGAAAGEEEMREAEARLERLSTWFRGEDDEDALAALGFETRAVSGRDVLAGTSFAFTEGSGESGFGGLWGLGTVTRFDGREDDLTLEGEVESALLGADVTRGRWAAGLAVGHSRADGGYASPQGDGAVASTLTGVYPYARYDVDERLSLWGVVGFGQGSLTLTPEGMAPIETDMALRMVALGGRSVLLEAPADGGLELAATSDALAVETTSEAVRGSGGSLAASEAGVTRLRVGLEGAWRGIGSLEPSFEIGIRRDGGDAETGFGADIGAGLAWREPARGIQAEVHARGLLTHEESGFRERGFAGSFAWDPDPASDLGPSLALRQTVGASATGGVDALLGPDSAQGLFPANDDEGDDLGPRRLEAALGYGLSSFGGRYVTTPSVGFGLTEADREVSHGWRLVEAKRSGMVFGLDVEAVRRERLSGAVGPEHRFVVGLGWQLEGARRAGASLELRLEGARSDVANDDAGPESVLGARFTTRW